MKIRSLIIGIACCLMVSMSMALEAQAKSKKAPTPTAVETYQKVMADSDDYAAKYDELYAEVTINMDQNDPRLQDLIAWHKQNVAFLVWKLSFQQRLTQPDGRFAAMEAAHLRRNTMRDSWNELVSYVQVLLPEYQPPK